MTTKTELLNNGVVVATKTAAPFYSWDWTPATSGASSLTYKRYEDNVLVFTSGAITGTVDAPGGSAISPDQLTNGLQWYDASDATKVTVDGSNLVTVFANKIGSNTLAPFDGSPIYDSGNGKIVFSSTQTLKRAAISQLSRTANWHIFLIFKANSIPTTGRNAFLGNYISASDRLGVGVRDGKLVVATYDGSAFNSKSTDTFTDTTGLHVLEAKNIGGVITAYIDDVEMTTTGASSPVDSDIRFIIGGAGQATDYDFEGYVSASSEITTQRTGLRQWITDKYGI